MTTVLHDKLVWKICNECSKKFNGLDLTMDILLGWANDLVITDKLPKSLKESPLKQALLIQHIDKFLNLNIRKKFGDRFPFFLTDANGSEKKYFLEELKQDTFLFNIFLSDIEDGTKRVSIALKLWAGATSGAKSTRSTYNTPWGEQPYTLEERKAGFPELANTDEIVRAGIQVAPILELIVRDHNFISLEGSVSNSPIKRYIMEGASLTCITSNDLLIEQFE